MKKQCKAWIFITIHFITIFNLLCYFSIRSMWSGIIRYTAEPVPYILLGVIMVTSLIQTLLSLNKKYPLLMLVLFTIIDILFLILNGFIISLTLDASIYFIREFLYNSGFLLLIGGIFLAIMTLHKRAIFQKKMVSIHPFPFAASDRHFFTL